MKSLMTRSVEEGVEHHKANPLRVYSHDGVQDDRVLKARKMLQRGLFELGPGPKSIMELGCGTLDISGPLSEYHEVLGVEVNQACIAKAKELYPKAIVTERELGEVEPMKVDAIVLCEVLEHLVDPAALVRRWLPLCRMVVISHPLDEPIGCGASGGDHQWSLTEVDLHNWFVIGGHKIHEFEQFQMGSYRIGLARGWRV
jgi:2-polyprenyl-3-methyl-5-hydroxy-6-metoxy-1,4-benzoquinol methylase